MYFVKILEEKLEGSERGVVKNLIHTYIERESQKELAQQLARFFNDKELLGLTYHSMSSSSKFTFVQYPTCFKTYLQIHKVYNCIIFIFLGILLLFLDM